MTGLLDAVIGLVRPVNRVWAFTSSSFMSRTFLTLQSAASWRITILAHARLALHQMAKGSDQ